MPLKLAQHPFLLPFAGLLQDFKLSTADLA